MQKNKQFIIFVKTNLLPEDLSLVPEFEKNLNNKEKTKNKRKRNNKNKKNNNPKISWSSHYR